ncbi:TPA: Eco57I restriction-modification methylase domain-containing protein, partial [Streptococcus suis]|nr:Eco57I restriction-modification methylase domain-containing protein [Streptococcus suis]
MVNSLKKNGVIYTPIELGKYMARKMFCAYNSTFSEDMTYSILDPSCGTGDLLEAAVLVAKELGIRVRVIGFDVDEIALEKAKERFKVLKIESDFFFDDFLKFSLDKKFDGPLFNDESHTYDFIISNPPYIRTQHLGEEYSKQLSKNFGLTGKIDIYQAFYAAFPSFMHSETVMSVITSNKFISNKTGKSLRNLLHKTFMIEEIIDLGDTKVFDAAVLPAIVIGKLCSDTQTNAPFYSVYETNAVVNVEEYKVNSFLNIIGNEPEGNFFVANQYYTGTK